MIFLIILTLIVELIVPLDTLIVEGVISTKEDWKFISRFCYLTKNGLVQYTFEYPSSYCCQDAILYYDVQWDSVYPQPQKSCDDKRRVADPKRNQILTLKTSFSDNGCHHKIDKDKTKKIVCSDFRKLSSARPRWWYLVISHCGFKKGLELKYKMIMTNGDTFWTKHFSADEQNILETDIFFACLQIILLFTSLYVAYLLSKDQLFHSTFKLFLWALFFEVLSVIVNIIYYVEYGEIGKPRKGLKNMGRGCHCISDTIFVVLLVLLGKGWTVTRARISPSGQIKLAVFCTLYSMAYLALFIYESKAFDPGQVLYIYESPAGIGICVMKIIAWLWFCYGIYFTLKNYERKRLFYYPFFLFYTIWFVSGPVLVLIATEVIEAHKREQVMNGVDRVVTFMAFTIFLMLTRPSSANKNFPYHVRTTQIGIAEDESNQNFEGCTYKASNESVHLQRNVASLFVAGGVPSRSSNETAGLCAENDERFPTNRSEFSNPGYTDSKESPPHFSQFSASTAPPYETLISGGGNFVNAYGDMVRKQQQQQQLQQQQQRQALPPESAITRTEQQLTSMFKAKSNLSPNLDVDREQSPSFLIPEPDDQFSPTPNGILSPLANCAAPQQPIEFQKRLSPLSTSHSPPSISPTNLSSPPQHTKPSFNNINHEEESNVNRPKETNSEAIGIEKDDNIPSDSNNNIVNEESKKKKRKKSKKGTFSKETSSTPKTLEPIVGLNREKLPPLRGGMLPPLSK